MAENSISINKKAHLNVDNISAILSAPYPLINYAI